MDFHFLLEKHRWISIFFLYNFSFDTLFFLSLYPFSLFFSFAGGFFSAPERRQFISVSAHCDLCTPQRKKERKFSISSLRYSVFRYQSRLKYYRFQKLINLASNIIVQFSCDNNQSAYFHQKLFLNVFLLELNDKQKCIQATKGSPFMLIW